ncbi:hypothetical protein M501DRAFT_1047003 [Patellaria atrata CBS 101060]|uniref:DNA polymerase delta subunit 3 n=1 Tax=Patellaria atrata CBS 101060 TaxID=1346257 RepID=A0A9P4S1H3_9PEZI|nr:hypothetical protein M501DRAFT_1047003 [Patellaria atrata CBS 101060]
MADKAREYLAINVLNENGTVSYRILSRALKVHVNLAKQLLFDFYHEQNAKSSNSISATYLITGTRHQRDIFQSNRIIGHEGESGIPQSSPFQSSIAGQDTAEDIMPITSVVLAREDDLDEVKAQFEEIVSIHIYSLQPKHVQDLQTLTDCTRRIHVEYMNEDPSKSWKQYGTIHNPNINRRTPRMAPPSSSISALQSLPKSTAKSTTNSKFWSIEPLKPTLKSSASQEGALKTSTMSGEESKTEPRPKNAPLPSLKRNRSDIFQSFAKAKPKGTKKLNRSPTEATPTPEDEPMKDASEEEQEEDFALVRKSAAEEEASRKVKAEREEHLRHGMWNDEDEPMSDIADPQNNTEIGSQEGVGEESDTGAIDKTTSPQQTEKTETATVSGGRRRGRRRVMKKKKVQDEEGYLVTREEAVWESFSEEDVQPKKVMLPAPTTGTGKREVRKVGQGNIMSFFGKKNRQT